MENHQLINQSSGKVEYGTPKFITDTAFAVMGGVDLDPASSPIFNRSVLARKFYTKEDNGLNLPWFGRVWMNHPFSREENARWINKLIEEFLKARVQQFCCICFASTSESWFQPLFAYHQCWLSPRTNYVDENGELRIGVSKGSVVTYGGPYFSRFAQEFRKLGKITRPA